MAPRSPNVGRYLLPELRPPRDLQPIKSMGVTEAPRAGWAARLFGGADPLQSGLLSVEDTRGLGRNALLNAGLSILANSGPSPYRRGLGEILAQGALAGQQAYQQGSQNLLGQQGTLQERQTQARLQALRQAYTQRFGGQVTPESVQALVNLAAQGDPEAAKMVPALANMLNANRAGDAVRGVPIEIKGPDGSPMTQLVDPTTGRTIGNPFPAMPPRGPNTGASTRAITKSLYDPFTVKTINAYHQFQSHIAEARKGNPAAYKAAVSAFITNAEPSNQLRLGMLQYLQEVDPSVQGRTDIALQRLKEGKWPDAVIEGMQQVVDDNYRQVRERTQGLYDWYLANDPEGTADVPPPSVRFGDAQNAPAAHGTSGASGFQIKPRRQ